MPQQVFECVSLATRDLLIDRQIETEARYRAADAKRLHYLSIEYLLGRMLTNNLTSLGIYDLCRDTLRQMNIALEDVVEAEPDAALGNGGLGRLAACCLDSLATPDLPACGYGINYEYGLFRQEIDNGSQKEKPDNWLEFGTPWEIKRADQACLVPVYGRIEHSLDRGGGYNPMWMDWRLIIGVPYDIPIVGYGGRTVNRLRLYSARSSHDFDMQIFNTGDYRRRWNRIATETISRVLYPPTTSLPARSSGFCGKLLVACAVRDIVSGYQRNHATLCVFHQGRHPSEHAPGARHHELMRTLVDERNLGWDAAWDIARST